jgi:L-arabinose transport system substrate-binding protein
MKVITVDDQFVNAKGEPMTSVPLVMMAASEIGARQGQELQRDAKTRLGCQKNRRDGDHGQ